MSQLDTTRCFKLQAESSSLTYDVTCATLIITRLDKHAVNQSHIIVIRWTICFNCHPKHHFWVVDVYNFINLGMHLPNTTIYDTQMSTLQNRMCSMLEYLWHNLVGENSLFVFSKLHEDFLFQLNVLRLTYFLPFPPFRLALPYNTS